MGSWRGPKNLLRLPINHPFKGELLGFEGEPVTLEGGERKEEKEQHIHPGLAAPALPQAAGSRRWRKTRHCDDEEAGKFSSFTTGINIIYSERRIRNGWGVWAPAPSDRGGMGW